MIASLSFDGFVAKSNEKFNSKYTFVASTFTDMYTRMSVVCPIHGAFEQVPATHLRSVAGCTRCGHNASREKRTTAHDDYIARAKALWGDKCDLTNTVYVNFSVPITVRCTIHNKDFTISPVEFTRGHGCRRCAGTHRYTTEEFIEECTAIHGNLYEYDKTVYVGSVNLVTIFCNRHQDYFQQKASNHLKGFGCLECSRKITIEKTRGSTQEFVARAQEVHGDKYDYSWVDYTHSNTKVLIRCKDCENMFYQRPAAHLVKNGCLKCGHQSGIAVRKANMPVEKRYHVFLKKAYKAHGNLYDYSRAQYVDSLTKIDIVCTKHGVFSQSPQSHARGIGCPSCSESKGEAFIRKYLDTLGISYIREYKIPGPSGAVRVNQYEYDFYLPEYHVFIEFHGRQHFKYIPFFHRDKAYFEAQRLRDQIKQHEIRANRGISVVLTHKHLKNQTMIKAMNAQIKHQTKDPKTCQDFQISQPIS